ncbi:hypothetical protein ACFW2D_37215 [Streptomyces sp. NPDC058914]|uniref:hypothetical protein n=1 Tax=Streptomyces sp. NPDC058914 TaxID=3346671 RepID=UPI00368E72B3
MFVSLRYSAACFDCGAQSECHGVQALVGDRLRWDVESACPACGSAVAVCGGELPAELRERILAEHGRRWLWVTVPPGGRVTVLRVLRTALGLDLAAARAALDRVLAGDHSGTPPEVERLARRLREAGLAAEAGHRPPGT